MAREWPEIPFAQLLAGPIRNGIYKEKEYHGRGVKNREHGRVIRISKTPQRADETRGNYRRQSKADSVSMQAIYSLPVAHLSLKVLESVASFLKYPSLLRSNHRSFAPNPIRLALIPFSCTTTSTHHRVCTPSTRSAGRSLLRE